MRVSFELPGDPYDFNRDIANRGIAYLKKLGVFFYRDELHQHGIVIDTGSDEAPILNKLNFPAFYYHGTLNFETLAITEWTTVDDEVVAKKGDDKAWVKWGEATNIIEFDPFSLRRT